MFLKKELQVNKGVTMQNESVKLINVGKIIQEKDKAFGKIADNNTKICTENSIKFWH